MTPDDLIKELRELFLDRHYQEALDLTSRHLPQVRPVMTDEHAVRIAEMMHVAQMAVDLEEAASRGDQVGPEKKVTRSA